MPQFLQFCGFEAFAAFVGVMPSELYQMISDKPVGHAIGALRANDFPDLRAVPCSPESAVPDFVVRPAPSKQFAEMGGYPIMLDPRLASFMTKHSGALLRYLRARGVEDADDLVQEIWLKLSQVDLAKIGELRAYVYRTAYNLMLDQAREKRRRGMREQTFQDLYVGEANRSREVNAELTLIEREHLARIDRALAECGARTDMIFRKHRVEQMPQRELAHEFGVTLSAIEKQLQKAYRAVAAAEREYQDQMVDREGGCDDRD